MITKTNIYSRPLFILLFSLIGVYCLTSPFDSDFNPNSLPEFTINLDVDASERFVEVAKHFKNEILNNIEDKSQNFEATIELL